MNQYFDFSKLKDDKDYRYVFLIGARKQGFNTAMKYLYIKKFLHILTRYNNGR